jgi:hypothetical protein
MADLTWDGQAMIYENGILIARNRTVLHRAYAHRCRHRHRAAAAGGLRLTSFGDVADLDRPPRPFREVGFAFALDLDSDLGLRRRVERFPFVPEPERLSELCYEAYNIQAHGLRQRLEATGLKRVVLGVSGDWIQPRPCWWRPTQSRCCLTYCSTRFVLKRPFPTIKRFSTYRGCMPSLYPIIPATVGPRSLPS